MSKDEERFYNPNLNSDEDYDEKAVEHVFRQGDYTNWDEVLVWLRDWGAEDIDLEPSQVMFMIDDIERVMNKGIEFTTDPDEASQILKTNRE